MNLFNYEKEKHLIGLLITNPEYLFKKPNIDENIFFNIIHKKIFTYIDDKITLKELDTRLLKSDWYKENGGVNFLIDCINENPYFGANDYALLVKELNDLYIARKLYNVSENIKEQIGKKENEDILLDLTKQIQEIKNADNLKEENELDNFDDIYGEDYGISSGFLELDNYLGGLKKQNLIVIGARPAVGKSNLAANIALNTSKEHHTLFFNLEMSAKEMKRRLIAIESDVPTNTILKQTFTSYEKEKIEEAGKQITTSGLKLFSPDRKLTISQIERIATNTQNRNGLDLIIIDYLNYIRPDEKSLQRTYQVEQRVQDLKLLSKQLDVPVILLVQLNRDIDKRNMNTSSPPYLSDIKDSGAIEQEADAVILMHKENKEYDLIQLHIRKNRHGRIGNFSLFFKGETGKFKNSGSNESVESILSVQNM